MFVGMYAVVVQTHGDVDTNINVFVLYTEKGETRL